MAEPFAIPADLEARWRPLTPAETTVAETLLNDASAQIRVEVPSIDDRITEGTLDPVVPTRVVVAMVKRAMSVDAVGVSGTQETAGPFSQSFNFANPMGDLYLTKKELRLLGGGRARAFMINPTPETSEGYWWP